MARVARLKIEHFLLEIDLSAPNRPHHKAPLRGGSLRSARYARARYARHPWRRATIPTRRINRKLCEKGNISARRDTSANLALPASSRSRRRDMLALLAASPAFVARPLPHQRIGAPRHSACVAAAKGDFCAPQPTLTPPHDRSLCSVPLIVLRALRQMTSRQKSSSPTMTWTSPPLPARSRSWSTWRRPEA